MKDILLVEDSTSDAELITKALRAAGVDNPIRFLSDGANAMAHLESAEHNAAIAGVPSVLLLDLKLPGFSGFEILERLQGRKPFEQTLRIVLSHLDNIKNISRAYRLGAHSFLTKPLHPQDVNDLIAMFPGYWLLRGDAQKNSAGTAVLSP